MLHSEWHDIPQPNSVHDMYMSPAGPFVNNLFARETPLAERLECCPHI